MENNNPLFGYGIMSILNNGSYDHSNVFTWQDKSLTSLASCCDKILFKNPKKDAWFVFDGSNPNEPIFYVSCDNAKEYVEWSLKENQNSRNAFLKRGLNADNYKIVIPKYPYAFLASL